MKTYIYFTESDRQTVEDLKQAYRKLALKYHPDKNPDKDTTQAMKDINNEFEAILESIESNTYYSSKERYKAGKEREGRYTEIINELMKVDGLTVELCGLWLWIGGETKKNKEQLKSIGCRWARKKKMWYWRPEGLKFRKKSKSELSMNQIRNHYGSETIKEESNPAAPTLFKQAN